MKKISLFSTVLIVLLVGFTTIAYANAQNYHGITTVGYGNAIIDQGGGYWGGTHIDYTINPYISIDQLGMTVWTTYQKCGSYIQYGTYVSYTSANYPWMIYHNVRSYGDTMAQEDVDCPPLQYPSRVNYIQHFWQGGGYPSTGNTQSKSAPPGSTFYDVPTTYWAYDFIEPMSQIGILDPNAVSNHCWSDFFCPEDHVTRAQMASFLERGMRGSNYVFSAPSGIFSDVPPDYWNVSIIEKLYADQVTGGCGLNPLRYCPESVVTRAQMAVFLLRAEHGNTYYPPPVGGNTGFNDVPTNYWAASWIKQLAAEGITGGCLSSPPMFCPEDPTTHAQMAVFLNRTFAP
jgi:hypothetical protein